MAGKFKDLSGQRFGKLVVDHRVDDYVTAGGYKLTQYDCVCDCGQHRLVTAQNLRKGKTKACDSCTNKYNFKSLVGQTFGHLYVEKRIDDYISSGGNSFVQYQCKCDCGRLKNVTALKLRSGHTKSCGQCNAFNTFIDLTGRRFDKLTVISDFGEYTYPDGGHDTRWLCECDCGRTVIIRGTSLKSTDSGHMCEYCRRHKRRDWSDMIGIVSGYLTVESRADDRYSANNTVIDCWNCVCKCGRHVVVDGTRIRHNYTKSCGCSRLETLSFTKKSSYEILVQNYLDEHHYAYVFQKTFDGLVGVNGGLLPYDFYIDDDVKLLVECQGEQHYTPVKFFGGEDAFDIRQQHDELKYNYAVEHNVPILQLDCRTDRSENDILLDLDAFIKSHI